MLTKLPRARTKMGKMNIFEYIIYLHPILFEHLLKVLKMLILTSRALKMLILPPAFHFAGKTTSAILSHRQRGDHE